MRKSETVALGIIIISLIIGIYFYPQMPEQIASHWNAQGQADGYMPKLCALFLMPLISFGLFLLFIVIPKIDPLKHNIEQFRKYYDGFVVLILAFLFYIYLLTISWSIGIRFNMTQLLVPFFCILFYYCGILIENAKRNWFVGIRTPWTMSSDEVWKKTHKLGGKLFKVCGIIVLLGIIFERFALCFVLIPVIFASIYTIVYSYFEYKKQVK